MSVKALTGILCVLFANLAGGLTARAETAGWAAETRSALATIDRVRVTATRKQTRIVIRADRPITPVPFELLSPTRLVVDIAGARLRLNDGGAAASGGFVRAFRSGEMAPGQARIVFDTTGRVAFSRSGRQQDGHYEFALTLTAPRTPLRGAALASATSARSQLKALRPSRFDTAPRDRRRARRQRKPVIVIDPGHGGSDPGAVTARGLAEKTIALSVGMRVMKRLEATQRFEVHATRTTDRFIPLDDRVAFAEARQANLFISLHADAVGDTSLAAAIRGATIYTVSETASDETARDLAEKENAADTRGGILPDEARNRAVRTILVDLMKRETTNAAALFRERLIRTLGQQIALSRSPRRAAAFRVLRQVATPAVLIELGYMSNVKDQKLMQSARWQIAVSKAIVGAISAHFREIDQRAAGLR